MDIAVNKVFTIYQKPRSRDFIDLYCILEQEKQWTLDDLITKAQVKFETYINRIQLASQFMKAEELKDYPTMLVDFDLKKMKDFFLEASKPLTVSELL